MKILVFVLGVIGFISQSNGVELVDLSLSVNKSFKTKIMVDLKTDLKSLLSMSETEGLQQRSQNLEPDLNHVRYYQTYQGVQIWPQQIAVSVKAGRLHRLHGILVKNLEQDIKSVQPQFKPKDALERGLSSFMKSKDKAWKFTDHESNLRIYVDPKTSKAKLVYIVSFFADSMRGETEAHRPLMVMDAKTGQLLEQIENLQHAKATGPGGNTKTGKYDYGHQYPAFDVTESTGGNCVMQTGSIKTVDLKNTMSGSSAYTFKCYDHVETMVNGAYGALNDAHYFAGVISGLYKDWYNTSPLKIPITMKVHYGKKYENAFWNGSAMHFGDGNTKFYPLVSLDVSSHEIAHGFTEFNSNLIYKEQSGGINEAFSDMAGEAAEFYSRGKNDFQIGVDIFKAQGKALRYMANPPQDGKSIAHVSQFVPGKKGTDVHHSSGIFNKAFYLLATTKGWNTRKAFDIFLRANQNYWTATTGFAAGARGVLEAAEDLGYPTADVVKAFAPVGIKL